MKRWMAVTVAGAVLALGTPVGAQEKGAHIEVSAFRTLEESKQAILLIGMMDGLLGSGRFKCGGSLRRAAIIAQVQALVVEHPREKVINVLITALEELGCTDILAEKPSVKPTARPNL